MNGKTSKEKRTCKPPGWKFSVTIYAAVWAACILWFWLGRSGGGWIMAYTILAFGVMLPVITLVAAFLLEWGQNLRIWRWAAMAAFGVMYLAALWATFALATFLGAANIGAPSPYAFLAGFCPAAVGIAAGWMVRVKKTDLRVPVTALLLLLCVCYLELKTLNGSVLRFLPILDLPAFALLISGCWFLFRKS